MAIIPKVFSSSVGQTIYDFVDIADGSGTIVLYGAKDGNLSGMLVKNSALYSANIVTTGLPQISGNNFAKYIDLDFDTQVNKPIILKGHAFFNLPMAMHDTGQAEHYAYADMILKKVHNGVETTIVSGSTNILYMSTDGTAKETFNISGAKMLLAHCIVPTTSYTLGDTLRINTKVYARVNIGIASYVQIAHDPKNRVYDHSSISGAFVVTDDTRMSVYLPTQINL